MCFTPLARCWLKVGIAVARSYVSIVAVIFVARVQIDDESEIFETLPFEVEPVAREQFELVEVGADKVVQILAIVLRYLLPLLIICDPLNGFRARDSLDSSLVFARLIYDPLLEVKVKHCAVVVRACPLIFFR